MTQTRDAVIRQLGLALEHPQHHLLMEEAHEALIQALADLLLEAFGDDLSNAQRPGGSEDEPEADI